MSQVSQVNNVTNIEKNCSEAPPIELFPPKDSLSSINTKAVFQIKSSEKTPAKVCADISVIFTRFYPECNKSLLDILKQAAIDMKCDELNEGAFVRTNLMVEYVDNSNKTRNLRMSLCFDCLLKGEYFSGFKVLCFSTEYLRIPKVQYF